MHGSNLYIQADDRQEKKSRVKMDGGGPKMGLPNTQKV